MDRNAPPPVGSIRTDADGAERFGGFGLLLVDALDVDAYITVGEREVGVSRKQGRLRREATPDTTDAAITRIEDHVRRLSEAGDPYQNVATLEYLIRVACERPPEWQEAVRLALRGNDGQWKGRNELGQALVRVRAEIGGHRPRATDPASRSARKERHPRRANLTPPCQPDPPPPSCAPPPS